MNIYFFISSNASDMRSDTQITVLSNSETRANNIVARKFKSWNYKGKPQRLMV